MCVFQGTHTGEVGVHCSSHSRVFMIETLLIANTANMQCDMQ